MNIAQANYFKPYKIYLIFATRIKLKKKEFFNKLKFVNSKLQSNTLQDKVHTKTKQK